MRFVARRLALTTFAVVPFLVAFTQDPQTKTAPTCEQVYKNIQAFKGKPASELIPAMEFMSASLHLECSGCHDSKDYSKDTKMKDSARHMIEMQNDINARNFGGRLRVTCMTCHRGSEHPVGLPLPEGYSTRHTRAEDAPSVDEILTKVKSAMGTLKAPIVRTGTLNAPNDETDKQETTPVRLLQASGMKFKIVNSAHPVTSDGSHVWYGAYPMTDEPAKMFERLGKSWSDPGSFPAWDSTTVSGEDKVGTTPVIVVRGVNTSPQNMVDLYFDKKTWLLLRVVNLRQSMLGNVATTLDYSDYRSVDGAQIPMTVVATFSAGLAKWTFHFDSAKVDPSVKDSDFKESH